MAWHRCYGGILKRRASLPSASYQNRLMGLVLSINSHPPDHRSLGLRVLVMVLGRKCPSFLANNLPTASLAPIDPRMGRGTAGLVFFIKSRVCAGPDIGIPLVKCQRPKRKGRIAP